MSKSPSDFIFDSVYKPAMAQGASERDAKDCAIQAVNDYKKSNYKTIDNLVSGAIERAKKL